MTALRPLERFLAGLAVAGLALTLVLKQATGSFTPCQGLANLVEEELPDRARDVVNACIGEKGEGGLGGVIVELGLAVTGQSREKMQGRTRERLLMKTRADLLAAGEGRCLIILAEGLVGRSNGGPKQLAQDEADDLIQACRGDDGAKKKPR